MNRFSLYLLCCKHSILLICNYSKHYFILIIIRKRSPGKLLAMNIFFGDVLWKVLAIDHFGASVCIPLIRDLSCKCILASAKRRDIDHEQSPSHYSALLKATPDGQYIESDKPRRWYLDLLSSLDTILSPAAPAASYFSS